MVKTNKMSKIKSQANPSQEVVVYNGPVRAPRSAGRPTDQTTVRMVYSFASSGSAVGMQLALGTGNITNCADWPRYTALYDEYRILGFEVAYLPRYGPSTAAVAESEGMVVTTHNPTNPGPFTSLAVMADYSDWKTLHSSKPFNAVWKMAAFEEAQYFATSVVPANSGWINVWFPYATTAAQYGNFVFTYAVQFRGRV